MRDLIFVFQNIEGEHIHYDSKEDAFRLDKKVSIYTLENDYAYRQDDVKINLYGTWQHHTVYVEVIVTMIQCIIKN